MTLIYQHHKLQVSHIVSIFKVGILFKARELHFKGLVFTPRLLRAVMGVILIRGFLCQISEIIIHPVRTPLSFDSRVFIEIWWHSWGSITLRLRVSLLQGSLIFIELFTAPYSSVYVTATIIHLHERKLEISWQFIITRASFSDSFPTWLTFLFPAIFNLSVSCCVAKTHLDI